MIRTKTAAPHTYTSAVSWARGDSVFTDNRYSRAHLWSFDGGVSVPASASPLSVRAPYSVAAAVDPEEALIASASSCHMLWFLSLAATRGYVVDSYVDEAEGVMEPNADGRMAITRITLRPRIEFSGETRPSPAELDALHHAAHDSCYIANSLRAEIAVEAAK
jgi:organic hydroperoxide reductase OsmC/OhrA